MVEKVVYKSGKFVDWLGQDHLFTVAGVVVSHKKDIVLASLESTDSKKCYAIPVKEIKEDGHVRKSLFIGVSICNPEDKDRFSEEIGKKIAYNRALCKKLPMKWLATNIPNIMTDDFVEFVVNKEAEFVAAHPEFFIKRYIEAKFRYEKQQCAKQEFAKLSEPEQEAVKVLTKGINVYKLVGIAKDLDGDIPSKDVDTNVTASPKQ